MGNNISPCGITSATDHWPKHQLMILKQKAITSACKNKK